jgi:methylthioribose-1-phosphate isomerase
MNVRGAPLIAIVGALGLAVELTGAAGAQAKTAAEAEALVRRCGSLRVSCGIPHLMEHFCCPRLSQTILCRSAEHLKTSRPTAVNLFTAMDDIVAIASKVRPLQVVRR